MLNNVEQFFTKYWYLLAGVVGILSGIVVAVVSEPIEKITGSIVTMLVPGSMFGVFSAAYFYSVFPSRVALWKLFLWIIVSSASYYAAVNGGIFIGRLGEWMFVVAGLIGVLILIIGFHLLILRLNFRYVLVLLLVGAIVPQPVVWALGDRIFWEQFIFPVIYVVWQTAVILLLGRRIHSEKNQSSLV